MKLYVIQHGKPVSKEVNPDRPLSEQGKKDVEQIASFLKKAGVSCSFMVHSGKTRARETAEILAHALSDVEPQPKDGLAPLDNVQEVARWIETRNASGMIVGHLPHLGKLVSWLVVKNENKPLVTFQQGGVVCLQADQHQTWTVGWMIVPELFLLQKSR